MRSLTEDPIGCPHLLKGSASDQPATTAVVLFALLGLRWPLLAALAIEAVPGLELVQELRK